MLSLARRSEATLRIKGSRFLAFALPVDSEDQARREIEAFETSYPDASHCCLAYRVSTPAAGVERSSDAGEPAGSAGAPILSVLKGRSLENVLVVVVRYFGGVKLGVGGLVRAYRDAAIAAIDAGEILERIPTRRLEARVPLQWSGEMRSHTARLGGSILSETYDDEARFVISIGVDRMEELRSRIDDLTRGAASWREA
ncbi:MAG TPA: YigZ family protein [Candidatus Polarisedimenticolia bacterium]|nr:YigZ family protein [Candidatus Polarisedimenticolia bacterium]